MLNLKNRRRILLLAIDLGIIACVYALAYLLSSAAGGFEVAELVKHIFSLGLFATSIFCFRVILRVYSSVWRYANSMAYLSIVVADAIGGAVALVVSIIIGDAIFIGGWYSVAIVAMNIALTLSSRFIYQQFHKRITQEIACRGNKINVAIVGAGQVGALLAEELLYFRGSHYKPLFFIDTSKEKIGSRLEGLPVFDENEEVFETISEYGVQEIFVAIPQLNGDEARRMLEFYSRTGCKVKLYDFASREDFGEGNSERRVIRDFKIEDLLFRSALDVTNEETRAFYKDKVVLITGGGGSIGSELARQVAKAEPKRLIIFDIYENNAYDIQQELIRRYGTSLDLVVEIGSVRDRDRLAAVFKAYEPEIVFHAAAHKHVPLMEHSNCEAIKNNVLGTYNTADMAERYGAKKFILISTDKAVNPTNIMGASKRLCEMVVQCRRDSATSFSAVRFGNVLGSNGSVIPLFKRQIAMGGPVTITDKRIIRYFMTIPEASGLVMQAGAMATAGELFVLDMGKPVKIFDLAENMIKLLGLRPHIDIEIVETGLRPGEKLYEELLMKTELLDKTENDMIFIERDAPLSREEVEEKLDILKRAVEEASDSIASSVIEKAMKSVVPTYHSPEEINKEADASAEMKAVFT